LSAREVSVAPVSSPIVSLWVPGLVAGDVLAGSGPSRRRALAEALELLQGEAELAEDLVEEGRSDLSATMDRNRHGPAVRVVPPLVASGLSTPDEAD
jgi:hypothetical protein